METTIDIPKYNLNEEEEKKEIQPVIDEYKGKPVLRIN